MRKASASVKTPARVGLGLLRAGRRADVVGSLGHLVKIRIRGPCDDVK